MGCSLWLFSPGFGVRLFLGCVVVTGFCVSVWISGFSQHVVVVVFDLVRAFSGDDYNALSNACR